MQPIFVVSLLLWLHPGAFGGSRRPARLIGGDRIIDIERAESPLKVLQYFVWIGEAWERSCAEGAFCNFFGACTLANRIAAWFVSNVCPLEDPNRVVCGGTLIAPRIVQTACHCVAGWLARSGDGTGYAPAWDHAAVLEDLEARYFIYMGQSNVKVFKYPIRSQKFLIHQSCGRLTINPRPSRYDVGWIVLERDVESSFGVTRNVWGTIDYAGPYRMAELNMFSKRVVDQRHVCLVTGFGKNDINGTTYTTTFKFGWIQMYDWQHCYDLSWPNYLRGLVDYKRSLSWACNRPLHNPYIPPFLGAQHYEGDSGSPITCGNNYFALVSSRLGFNSPEIFAAGEYNISKAYAIFFDPYSATVEGRKQFETLVYELAEHSSFDPYFETTTVRDRELRVLLLPNRPIPQAKGKLGKGFELAESLVSRLQPAWAFHLCLLQAIVTHNYP